MSSAMMTLYRCLFGLALLSWFTIETGGFHSDSTSDFTSSYNKLAKPDFRKITYEKPYVIWKECFSIPFLYGEVKIPICRKIIFDTVRKTRNETRSIEPVDAKAANEIRRVGHGILQDRKQFSTARGQPHHDNDMCCPTVHSFREAPFQMKNIYGQQRDIFHISEYDLYQYIPVGKCLKSSEHLNCKGTCVQEMRSVYLMALQLDMPGFSFEPFNVESYCSCKKIGQAVARPGDESKQKTVLSTGSLDAVDMQRKLQENKTRITSQVTEVATEPHRTGNLDDASFNGTGPDNI